jgi:hypothetical protein
LPGSFPGLEEAFEALSDVFSVESGRPGRSCRVQDPRIEVRHEIGSEATAENDCWMR